MPQLIEPTTPEAQREIIRQSLNEIAAEVATALRDAHLDFPVFLTVPNSGQVACNDGLSARPVRWRLVTCFSHRLSDHRATTGRRSAARTAITLRGGECDDGCRRCDGRRGERGMTVSHSTNRVDTGAHAPHRRLASLYRCPFSREISRMAAGPTGAARRRDSLPAQEAAADPLQNYCPDLDQLPGSWACDARHAARPAHGGMLQAVPAQAAGPVSVAPHLRRHRDNIWALGGEVISRLQMDRGLRRRPIEQAVLELIGADGGPLRSHGQSETEQRSLQRNLPQSVSRPDPKGPTSKLTAATNRSRH